MAHIQLANGQTVKELRVWGGVKWEAKTGRIHDGTRWINFIRPGLTFKDDLATQAGMSRYNTSTHIKSAVNAGTSILPVQTSAGFYVGQEVTITDGVNIESVRVTAVGVGSLTVTPLSKTYKNNAIVARSNTDLVNGKNGYPIRTTYTITAN